MMTRLIALVPFVLLLSSAALAQTQPATPPAAPAAQPPACTTPEHRQFDFWVGNWNVYRTGTEQQVGTSRIETLYNGCAIRENWMPLRGGAGGSLNSWLPQEGKWRQTWVDSGNSYAVFEGQYRNDEMVMTGVWAGAAGPGSRPLIRMYWSRVEGGIRQRGEQSTDNGQTWAPNFDFTYRPANPS